MAIDPPQITLELWQPIHDLRVCNYSSKTVSLYIELDAHLFLNPYSLG